MTHMSVGYVPRLPNSQRACGRMSSLWGHQHTTGVVVQSGCVSIRAKPRPIPHRQMDCFSNSNGFSNVSSKTASRAHVGNVQSQIYPGRPVGRPYDMGRPSWHGAPMRGSMWAHSCAPLSINRAGAPPIQSPIYPGALFHPATHHDAPPPITATPTPPQNPSLHGHHRRSIPHRDCTPASAHPCPTCLSPACSDVGVG